MEKPRSINPNSLRSSKRLSRGLATAMLAGMALAQGFAQDVVVYADALQNSYVDWSWATVNLADKTYHHSGSTSAKVTYTGGYQAFRLHGPTLSLKAISGLTFFINGGSTAGRSLKIGGSIGNNVLPDVDLTPYIAGKKVPANAWAKVTVPLSALGLKSTDQPEGFWLQDSSGKAQPAFWVDDIAWNTTVPPSTVYINVSPSAIRKVDLRHFGINVACYDGILDTKVTKSRVAEAGYRILRYPGGSLSDTYHWQTNKADGYSWSYATNFDAFADMAKFISAQSFITVNYGSGTPKEANDWVTYSKSKKYGYTYWELGNEVYGTWESDTHARKNDPYTYAQQFAIYYKQMKATDPSIKLGAVAAPGEDNYVNWKDHPAINPRTKKTHYGWTCVMLTTMAQLGVTPDYLIYHRYPEYPGIESDFALLNSQSGWATDIADLRQELVDYLPKTAAKVEILCNENNSGTNGKQETSLVGGLYLADSFGSVIQTECNSYVFWDLYNGQNTSGNNAPWLYGWRQYGDDGQLDPNGNPYPTFYVEKLIAKFATPGATVLPTSSSYPLVTSYSVQRTDGSVAILLVNKHATQTILVQSTVGPSVNKSTLQVYGYGIPQDTAARTGVGSQDIYSKTLTNLASNYSFSLPPYSVAVLVYPKK